MIPESAVAPTVINTGSIQSGVSPFRDNSAASNTARRTNNPAFSTAVKYLPIMLLPKEIFQKIHHTVPPSIISLYLFQAASPYLRRIARSNLPDGVPIVLSKLFSKLGKEKVLIYLALSEKNLLEILRIEQIYVLVYVLSLFVIP